MGTRKQSPHQHLLDTVQHLKKVMGDFSEQLPNIVKSTVESLGTDEQKKDFIDRLNASGYADHLKQANDILKRDK